jgi:zinc protease
VRLDARAWSGEHGGSFVVSVTGRRGLVRAVRAVERGLARLATDGPSEGELARVRAGERTALLRGMEAVEDRAQVLNLCFATTGEPECIGDVSAAWDALTPADVARVARTWLDPRARATLTVVPPGRRPPGALR